MVVAFVCVFVDLGDTEGKKRERQKFEAVLGGCAVGNFGQQRVLGAGLLVCGGLEGAYGSLDCCRLAPAWHGYQDGGGGRMATSEHVFSLLVVHNRPGL